MKRISDLQCQAIVQELTRLNVPCQTRDGIQMLLANLPTVEEAVSTTNVPEVTEKKA